MRLSLQGFEAVIDSKMDYPLTTGNRILLRPGHIVYKFRFQFNAGPFCILSFAEWGHPRTCETRIWSQRWINWPHTERMLVSSWAARELHHEGTPEVYPGIWNNCMCMAWNIILNIMFDRPHVYWSATLGRSSPWWRTGRGASPGTTRRWIPACGSAPPSKQWPFKRSSTRCQRMCVR